MTKIVVDIAILAFCALVIFVSVKRGFVKSFFRFSKVILSILITFLLKNFASGVCSKLFVRSWFEGKISKSFLEKVQSAEEVSFNSLFDSLPKVAQNIVSREELEGQLGSAMESGEQLALEMGTRVEEMLISVISTFIGCFAVFVISFALLSLLAFLLERIVRLPVLKQLNGFLGFLWGTAYAYILVSVIAFAVLLFVDVSFIDQTKILKFFYNYGLFT